MKLIESDWDGDREAICDTIPEFEPATENFNSKPIAEFNTEGMSNANDIRDSNKPAAETKANEN